MRWPYRTNPVQDQPDTSNYKRTQNIRATPISPVGTLFMVNVLAFVDCATAGREGLVTFEDGRKAWLAVPALAPLTTLAALAAYAVRFCGPDGGLKRLTAEMRRHWVRLTD
jgi:hypothetical protein